MLLKLGSKGQDVKELQSALGLKPSGVFDQETKEAVETYQRENGLMVDGIVGSQTFGALRAVTVSTDQSEKVYSPYEGLTVNKYFLPDGEYFDSPTSKEYLFLHHTLGWNNPYRQVDSWAKDNRGPVATEFLLGGRSIKDNDDRYDGEVVQCMPEGAWAYHLGESGSAYKHKHSLGIEVCNFGQLKDGKTYTGRRVATEDIVTLSQPFRGYTQFHAYTDKQIETLRLFILWIAERDSIEVRDGLVAEIKKNGVAAFEFNEDAFRGRIKGMWTHTNTRLDKIDLSPQPNLIDMLLSL